MARRNKKNRNKNHQKKQQAPTSLLHQDKGTPTPPSPAKEIEKLHAAASSSRTEEGPQTVLPLPMPDVEISVEELITKGREALALLEQQRQKTLKEKGLAKKEREALAKDQDSIAAQKQDIQGQKEELNVDKAAVAKDREAQQARDQALLEREERLVQREADADAGFVQRHREAVGNLEKEVEAFREEFSAHRTKIARERQEWEGELLERRTALQSELDSRREEFDEALEKRQSQLQAEFEERTKEVEQRLKELPEEEKRLRTESLSIQLDRELLDEDRKDLENRVEQFAASKLEQCAAQAAALEERLAAARQERDDLSRRLLAKEEAERRFGAQTPEEVSNELNKLRTERDQLKEALSGRPTTDALGRLQELERQKEQWEAERLRLVGEAADLRQDVAHKRIAVTELESLRNHKAALEASNALLQKALQEEIGKINDLVKGADGQSPFPSCASMDRDNDLQSPRTVTEKIKSLKDLTAYVRHYMGHDPATDKSLYYSLEDVRSFIAGLAMSRLHLLQGISGTGKTSLPLAFSRAIGAGRALVEVQAGWRDRQDLIGHFNTFERRFHESEFLQALYKASCPQYRDRPFIVVLDEMNLSHPEQYFADLLSALEQEQSDQRLVLMTAAVEGAPTLLTEGGRALCIPPNVWFVGTANHDETTKDFADKTYDRAHVMELPRHRNPFSRTDLQPTEPLGFEALQKAFEKAATDHGEAADAAYRFLETELGDILGQRFRVGWGNRLQRQMESFVPVVIACGGGVGEATDHILATKLLRKIRDRHDNRPEDVVALREKVTATWAQLDTTSAPAKSESILEEELHRLGYDQN